MAPDLSGPADTSMMRIVHNALRRDLTRAQDALAGRPYPDHTQRNAICAQLRWMLGFLHRHHEYEDNHLYPMVRAANASAAAVIDDMAAEHDAVQGAITAVSAALGRYEQRSEARAELLAALGSLSDVLLPHLRREETEMMPVVSATITDQQWRDLEQEHNVKPLSPRDRAFTGLWIIDGQDEPDQDIVAALVPPVPRWIIRHVLVLGYRRSAFRCWQLPQHSPLKLTLAGAVSAHASAPPEAVWPVVTDVTRVGEWSHECQSAAWTGGSSRATVGAQFRGRSRSGISRWSRVCTVVLCTEPVEFAYRTRGRLFGDATEWHFSLEPEGTGTRITQHYRVRSMYRWADRLVWLMLPAHHDRLPALAGDLERLSDLASREHASTSRIAFGKASSR
jgi:hemerythrin-like domain-containing protein